ncbi:MAG: hypothetical protein WCG47_28785, partial [Dermatophilaceae bacterium]
MADWVLVVDYRVQQSPYFGEGDGDQSPVNGVPCFGSTGCGWYMFVGCWLLGRLVSPFLALCAVTARKLWA